MNDINEIYSVDLAYVDKLAKHNRDVKYLLVAVDCLSRYHRVEPTKKPKEIADAFKKRIKYKQPEKVKLMMEQNFSELLKDFATEKQFICVALLVKKVCFREAEYSFTEKHHP